jgi:uncharacterized membrane protein YkoI
MSFCRLSLPLIASLVVSAGGCGGNDDEPSAAATATRTPTATETPTETPTATPTATATQAARTASKRISRAQAIRIARKRAGGGRVTEAERDDEDNRAVWKVKIRRGRVEHKVSVAVRNGRVVKYERDRDDRDRDDGNDDRDD